jgi:hypothetical protein
MAFDGKSLDSYVDVATRVAEFRAAHPSGSLQPTNPAEPWRMVQVQGFEKDGDTAQQTFIVYTAAAYRTPDDQRPGIGCAWEIFPGRTPYTRGSELMNAETSAWGRAIVAALAADTRKGIATRQDVERANGQQADPWNGQPPGDFNVAAVTPEDRPGNANRKQLNDIHRLLGKLGIKDREPGLALIEEITGGPLDGPEVAKDGTHRTTSNLSYRQAVDVIQALKEREAVAHAAAEQDKAAEEVPS